jgi:hypothetical protein
MIVLDANILIRAVMAVVSGTFLIPTRPVVSAFVRPTSLSATLRGICLSYSPKEVSRLPTCQRRSNICSKSLNP